MRRKQGGTKTIHLCIVATLTFLLIPAPLAKAAPPPLMPIDGSAQFVEFAADAVHLIGPPQTQENKAVAAMEVANQSEQSVSFWAYDFRNHGYYQLSATLRRTSAHAYIYVENGQGVSDQVLDSIASQFDSPIYSTTTSIFGSEPRPGIDGDVRITILILDIRDPYYYGSGSVYMAGYFSAVNEYTQADLDNWYRGQHKSNEREMVYMDCSPGSPGSTVFLGTLAHEFQHVIHWNQDPDEETWINEGASGLAQYLSGYGHPTYHVQAFVQNPNDQLTAWRSTLADYGAAYLWMLYFWEKYGGHEAVRRLVAEPANGISGVDSVLAAQGYADRFADAFARWTVANYLDDPNFEGGLYGYHSIDFVSSGANGSTSFPRPTLAASHSAYPVNGSGSTEYYAAIYYQFTGNGSDLNLSFNGHDDGAFTVSVVESTTAGFATGSNAVEPMTLNASKDGSLVVSHSYQAALLIPASTADVGATSHEYVAEPTPTPPPPETGAATIYLQAGWNLISLPLEASYTAESMIQEIKAQGGDVTEVDRWHAGGWNAHLAGLPFNDFPIELGRAYLVKATKPSTWTISGRQLSSPVAVSLAAGWNTVSVPYATTAYTAESLAQAINAQGGSVAEVQRWHAGGWNAHLAGLPFNDFPIEASQGYFIRVNKASTWTPQ